MVFKTDKPVKPVFGLTHCYGDRHTGLLYNHKQIKFLPCAFSLLPPGILIQLSLLPLLSFHQKVHWNIEITPFQPCEQWLLPLSLDELVPQNHFVRIVSKTVDETRNRRSICPKHKRRRRKQIQSDYVV